MWLRVEHSLATQRSQVRISAGPLPAFGKLLTHVPLSPCSTIWYWPSAGKVTAGLVESNGSLLPGKWLKVTCGLTDCTPGSAPGPMLRNKYGRTLPFTLLTYLPTTCTAARDAVSLITITCLFAHFCNWKVHMSWTVKVTDAGCIFLYLIFSIYLPKWKQVLRNLVRKTHDTKNHLHHNSTNTLCITFQRQ